MLVRGVGPTLARFSVQWQSAGELVEAAAHDFRLTPKNTETLAFTCGFSPEATATLVITLRTQKLSGALWVVETGRVRVYSPAS